jgi:hypothetical protein
VTDAIENGDDYTGRTSQTVLLNECYGGEHVEENEMAGHSVRIRDGMYIYFHSEFAKKLGSAQTAGIFINPRLAE